MGKRIYLLTILFSAVFVGLVYISLTKKKVPTNNLIPIAIPVYPPSDNELCENEYMPIVDDITKLYAIEATLGDTTSSSTNYETIFYSGDRNYFSVSTRLERRTGKAVHEHWDCNNRGFVRTAFEGGEFSAFFANAETGFSETQTTDWCSGGVTLPRNINAGDTWMQRTDFAAGNWLKPLNSQTLPLPSGSGRFIYKYEAIGIEQLVVPTGTYDAIRIDVTAEGHIDPSRVFSPTFKGTTCSMNSNEVDQINPLMILTFEGTTWWAKEVGWVKKIGTVSDSEGIIESFEMKLESIGTP